MYAEVTVIVNGALEEEETFHDYALMDAFLAEVRREASSHGYPTEVFVLYHEHPLQAECECIQFETDHHPLFTYNLKEKV